MGNTMITCCPIRPRTVRVYRDKGQILDFPFRLPASRLMQDYPNHLLVYRSVRGSRQQNPREMPGAQVLNRNVDIRVVRWGQTLEVGHDYFLVNIPEQYHTRFAKYFNPKSPARSARHSLGARFSPGPQFSPRCSPGPQFSPRCSPGAQALSSRCPLGAISPSHNFRTARGPESSPRTQDIQRKQGQQRSPWRKSPNSRKAKSVRQRRGMRSPAHKSPVSKGQGRICTRGEGSDARASYSGQEHRPTTLNTSSDGKVSMGSIFRGFRSRRYSRKVWKPVLESISETAD